MPIPKLSFREKRMDRRISRKLLTMDFCAADDAATHDLLSHCQDSVP